MNSVLIGGAISYIATHLGIIASRPVLRKMNLVDVPNYRSSHTRPTLRAGGVGPTVGFLAGSMTGILIGGRSDFLLLTVLCIGGVAAVGFSEDFKGLSIKFRLALQLFFGMTIGVAIGMPGHSIVLAGIAGAVLVTFYVNTANFMDGINGISACHGIIGGLHFGLLGYLIGEQNLIILGAVIFTVNFAFLPWNVLRGNLFLGDVGSYLLGASIASTALFALSLGAHILLVVSPLIIYSSDVLRTLTVRLRRGDNLTAPHREHVYQVLQRQWESHAKSAGFNGAATIICCLVAWLTFARSPLLGMIAIVVIASLYLKSPLWLRPHRHGKEPS